MYQYHGMIKKRIRNGELIGYQFVDDYPKIGKVLLLTFLTEPRVRPIRPHRFEEYNRLLRPWCEEKGFAILDELEVYNENIQQRRVSTLEE